MWNLKKSQKPSFAPAPAMTVPTTDPLWELFKTRALIYVGFIVTSSIGSVVVSKL
jgi:hypothetical protein